MIEILSCGTTVTTKIGAIRGIITAVSIRFEKAQYEISYFTTDGDRKEVWCDEREFEITQEAEKIKIGFR